MMPTHRSHPTSSGFSLIEILAVVLILGLMATGAMIIFSAGGPKKDFHAEIEKFVGIAHQIGDFAIVTGEPMGLVLTPPAWSSQSLDNPQWTYSWRRFIENPNGGRSEWRPLDGIEPITMDADIELFVHIEGDAWEWEDTPPNEQPIFVMSPSGEAEPFLFEIEFVHRNSDIESQHVEYHQSGRLQWREVLAERQALEDRFE